eukprot:350726-Chlamydomonas_euryale.AAC.1
MTDSRSTGRMDGWMDGWMDDGWMDGWLVGWITGWMDVWMTRWCMTRGTSVLLACMCVCVSCCGTLTWWSPCYPSACTHGTAWRVSPTRPSLSSPLPLPTLFIQHGVCRPPAMASPLLSPSPPPPEPSPCSLCDLARGHQLALLAQHRDRGALEDAAAAQQWLDATAEAGALLAAIELCLLRVVGGFGVSGRRYVCVAGAPAPPPAGCTCCAARLRFEVGLRSPGVSYGASASGWLAGWLFLVPRSVPPCTAQPGRVPPHTSQPGRVPLHT